MRKYIPTVLGIIQLFVAIGALPAGYSMIVEPDGSGLGMTLDILTNSPFSNFFIPGIFLFTVNGVFNLISAFLSFFKYKYSHLLGLGLGIALLIWVSVQVYSIGLTHILQPIYFAIGTIEIALSIWLYKTIKLQKTIG